MKKVALYCRTSTSGQEKEETVQTQLSKLREIYDKSDIAGEYLDEGYSGTYLHRPALERLKEDATKGLFNTIGIYSLDRLSRKTGHGLLLQEIFDKLGVKIEVLGQDLKNTPEGRFSNTIFSAISEYEKDHITQRMRDGKYRKAKEGKLIGCYPSWGYKLIKRDRTEGREASFEIDKAEDWKIKRIFEVYLREQSLREACRVLFEEGISARGKKNEEGKYQRPIWSRNLKAILTNESYIGNFYYGKTYYTEASFHAKKHSKVRDRGGLTGRRWRPKEEWKLIKIPAIIDEAVFNTVQEIIEKRKKNFFKKTKHEYLCQGLIKCLHCGHTYSGKPTGKPFEKKDGTIKHYTTYACYTKQLGKEKCSSRRISGDFVDKAVWEEVEKLINDPGLVKDSIKVLIKNREENKGENLDLVDVLKTEQQKIKVRKSRILDLYSDDNFSRSDLDEKVFNFNKQEELLGKQVKEVEEKIKKVDNENAIEKEVEKICLNYQKIQNKSFRIKKLITRHWVEEINIKDDKTISIKMTIPNYSNYSIVNPSISSASLKSSITLNF